MCVCVCVWGGGCPDININGGHFEVMINYQSTGIARENTHTDTRTQRERERERERLNTVLRITFYARH